MAVDFSTPLEQNMATTAIPQRWLSMAQASERLGVTERTLRAYISRGALTAHRVRGSRLIRIDIVELDGLMRPIPSARKGA